MLIQLESNLNNIRLKLLLTEYSSFSLIFRENVFLSPLMFVKCSDEPLKIILNFL